jgi:phosphatidylserine/phosphatidylglycerophosphate/cardiolipin synthase-like enzyme
MPTVRVRFLLHDNNTDSMDKTLPVLDAHPNIEVRRFHPYANRSLRLAELATGFARLNRRPQQVAHGRQQAAIVGHAKTFAVDRSRIFVESFNFDPPSARHNTR